MNESLYIMYFVVNQDLKKMGAGKIAAQVAHGAVLAWENTPSELRIPWQRNGWAKVVLIASEAELLRLHKLYPHISFLIEDQGRTQIPSGSITVLSFIPQRKGDLPELAQLKLHP